MSNMDEIFRKQLHNRQEAVPGHLWSGIEKQLQEAPKCRILPYYIAVVGVLGLLLAAFAWWGLDRTSDATAVNTVVAEQPTVSDQGNQQSFDSQSQSASTSATATRRSTGGSTPSLDVQPNDASINVDNSKITTTVSAVQQRQIQDNDTSARTAMDDDGDGLPSSTTLASTQARLGSEAPSQEDARKSETSNSTASTSDKAATSTIEYDATSAVIERSTVDASESTTTMTNNTGGEQAEVLKNRYNSTLSGVDRNMKNPPTTGIQWIIEQTDNVTVNTISAPEIMKSEAFNRRRELYRTPEEIQSVLMINLLESEEDWQSGLTSEMALMYTECPSFSSDVAGFFVDAYMSHDWPIGNIDSKTGTSTDLADLRSSTESTDYSYGFGGRLSLRMPSGWSIRTGLHYAQINETITFMEEGLSTFTHENRYSMFDLPLLVGKDFGADGSRVYFSASAGVLVNMVFSQDAIILDDQQMLVPAEDAGPDQRNAYKDAAGMSLYGSAAIYYRLLDNLDIYAGPYVRHLPNSLTTEDYELDHNFTVIGLNTGVRMRF